MVVTVNVHSDGGITVIFVKAMNVPSCRTPSADTSVKTVNISRFGTQGSVSIVRRSIVFQLCDHISCRRVFREELTVPVLLE